uniref:Uncharacterized protein n=1 Tax=Faecalibaculum rodentium TaxID=1702221 RepID=A0A140DUE4_9FIRM|nr:hypothetical protein AALO17_11370 [Faecalibaculum rodentium]
MLVETTHPKVPWAGHPGSSGQTAKKDHLHLPGSPGIRIDQLIPFVCIPSMTGKQPALPASAAGERS